MSEPLSLEAWPPATPWRRAAAAVIDCLILALPFALLWMVHPAVSVAVAIAYGALLEGGARQATLGKRACAIEVMAQSGERLAPGRALVRNALKFGALALFGDYWGALVPLALFVPVFMPARQGLHDLAVKSVVRHEPARGLTQLQVGIVATVVPVLFVAGFLPLLVTPIYNARATRQVASAVEATAPRRAQIEEYYRANQVLPEGQGVVMVKPEGVKGLLIFTPEPQGDGLRWRCSAQGIPKGQLPAQCRDD